MTITLLQQDIVWASPSANQEAAERAILTAPKSDLYVLPEMWSTGFATEPEGIAETDGSSLHWMEQMAIRMDAAIAGSVATRVDDSYYNRFYFVKPTGEVSWYDKHHLFTYGGEHRRYTAGRQRVVVEWRGVRFLLQVCYDLRFPCFSRNRVQGDEAYDVALYVASWPTSRRLPWDTLLRARAIENQCYVCGVDRVGTDPACAYNGGTALIDAYGRTVAACPDGEVAALTASIDLEGLRAFRQKFPVLDDRDC
ncbi:MAG: amidohydrolase [Prevotellaceae bacterium]|nr:amidohydrolase [Prevotellaceae bacterium]